MIYVFNMNELIHVLFVSKGFILIKILINVLVVIVIVGVLIVILKIQVNV